MAEQPEVRFLVSWQSRDDYLTIEARPVHFIDGKIRNPSSGLRTEDPLADFVVSAVANQDPSLGEQQGGTYGWHRGYKDVYTVDVCRAEIMVKHLRKLDRDMAKLEQKLGFADTFPIYLTRVAFCLNISQFGRRVGGSGWSYDTHEYEWRDGTWVADWVRQALADFRPEVTA